MSSPQQGTDVRFHGLDTLRSIAIVAVVLFHLRILGLLPSALDAVARVGWIGVDLFFVLSGFLIGSQLLKPYAAGTRPPLGEFYARRAYRILPAFVVVLLLYIFVPLWREASGPYAIWQYASFTWNLFLLHYPEGRAFSHIWSLCVEEHFYLVLPLLMAGMFRKPSAKKTAWVVGLMVVGGMVLRAWLFYAVIRPAGDDAGLLVMKRIYYPTYSRLDGLTMGVVLAALRTFRPKAWEQINRHGHALALLGVAFVVCGMWLCGFDYPNADLPASLVFAFPAIALGFMLLVASALAGNGILRHKVPGMATLAALSYSLYLTHKSVAHAVHHLLPRITAQADWRSLSIYLLVCLLVATLLYLGVEKPFLALRSWRSCRSTLSDTR